MTAPASSQAHVEAVLDFANLDKQFAAKLTASTQQAERVVQKNLAGITRAAQASQGDINKAFDQIVLGFDEKPFTTGLDKSRKKAAAAADDIGESFDDVGKKARGAGEATEQLGEHVGGLVGKAGGAVAGLVAVGGAMDTIGEAISRTDLSNKLGAQLALTKDQSAQAGQIAGQVYADNYGESFEGVTEAAGAVMSSLADLGDNGGASVEDLTKRVLVFGDTFGLESGEIAQAANNMIQQGLATDAPQALDLLATSFQRVPAQMRDEIFPIINEYGTYLHTLGFDGAASMGLIVNASQEGAIAMDKVGDAVKEFGIRATDLGDTGAQDALKGLGLDAAATANELLAGGDTAQTAFGKIVNGLLGIQDPGQQAAAAIALFGTPLEDLDKGKIPGFLMGLSDAGASMEGFGGTVDAMGQRLSEGPGAKLEELHRQIQQTLVDGLGTAAGYVTAHADTFKVLAVAVGAVVGVYGLLRAASVVSAASMGVHAAATGADTASLAANRIAMGAHLVASVAMRAGMLAGAAATGIATAATWAFNAAMAVLTSPITLVIVAIGAIIAALVLLYNKNETFRNFVQAAWAGIQAAIQVAWQFIQIVFQAISQWVTGTLVPVMQNLWSIAGAVFNGIATVVQYVWATFLQPIINDLAFIITGVIVPAFLFWWHNVVEPMFAVVGAIISAWWTGIVQPAFDGVKAAIGLVGDVFVWLWHTILEPVFNGAKAIISDWWTGAQIIFEQVKSGIGLVGDAFHAAGSVMSGIWDGVVAAIRPAVHLIGSLLAKVPTKIGPIEIPGGQAAQDLGNSLQKFAGGGLASGPGTGTSDSILAAISDGEFVTHAAATGRWLPILTAINSGANAQQVMALLLSMLPGFAGGGLVNTRQLEDFARGIDGVDYVWGGWGNGWSTDCSGAASALANYATSQVGAGQGQRSGTGGMSGFLSNLGAQPGIGPKGSLAFGWYNGGPYGGHIGMTLPTGENVEMGGKRGNGQFGGAAAGADMTDATDHMHFPPEFFVGGDLGGGAGLSAGAGAALNGSGGGTSGTGASSSGGGTSSSGGGLGSGANLSADATKVFVTNWPTGGGTPAAVPGAPTATTPAAPAAAGATPGTDANKYGVGIDAANHWAADQDFAKQGTDWATGFFKEIFGQVTDPLGVKSLSDQGVDNAAASLKTAAEALQQARANTAQPLVGVMNVNGASDPLATANAVVSTFEQRFGVLTGRYRNGG